MEKAMISRATKRMMKMKKIAITMPSVLKMKTKVKKIMPLTTTSIMD